MSIGVERAVAQPHDDAEFEVPNAVEWPEPDRTTATPPVTDELPERSRRPALGALLVLLTVAWLGACGLALYRAAPPMTLINVVSWMATISVPVVLLGLTWLIFGRTSRAETEQFTRAVVQMREEAETLDRVLASVAERIASNREQLSGETARLMKLGEEASDRLGRVTHYLARESADLERKSGALDTAAAQARVDMGVLLADLPQAEQAARSFSETLREAGVSAHERSRALEAQLSAIAARAQDADVATGGAAERLSAHIARIETSAGVAAEQLDEARARLDAAVDGALTRTTEAVEATRAALDAQAQGLLATVDQGKARFTEAGADASRQLAERIEEAQRRLVEAGTQSSGEMAERLDEAQRLLVEAGGRSGDELTERLQAAQRQLVEAASVRSLEAAERLETGHRQLVEATDAGTRQMVERLDAAQSQLVTAAEASGRTLAEQMDQARMQLTEAGARSGAEISERLESAQRELIQATLDSSRQLTEQMEVSRERLVEASVQAGRAVEERMSSAQNAFAGAGAAASTQLGTQLAEAGRLVEAVSAGIAAQEQAGRNLLAVLAQEIAGLEERLTGLDAQTDRQVVQMSTALAGLRDATATMRQEVGASTQEAAALVARTQDMGGALDAVAVRLRDELPPALSSFAERAAAARETALSLAEPVTAFNRAADQGAARLAEAEASLERQRAAMDALLGGIEQGVGGVEDKLRALAAAVNSADDSAALLVRETGPELVDALVRVREAARLAGTHARDAISAAIPESAANLADAVQKAVDASVTDAVRQQIAGLDAASQHAALAARKASERLTRQLLTLGQSAAALEGKIEEERALREDQDRGGMARRVALLIESLNSTAIDVTKILSNDITDTAWSAYLKGDRGVFTRRAVRLLETGEAREIARHYEEEPEFREQVSRYIHDFETMLRRVMGDSEGDTLSIALLSSDMGKLYVALAQAIERLRR